jgi:hypothetical protein
MLPTLPQIDPDRKKLKPISIHTELEKVYMTKVKPIVIKPQTSDHVLNLAKLYCELKQIKQQNTEFPESTKVKRFGGDYE